MNTPEAPDLDRVLALVQQVPNVSSRDRDSDQQAERAQAAATVLWQHEQRSEVDLAPGQWCPQCGEEVPCPDERRARAALAEVEAWAHRHGAEAPAEPGGRPDWVRSTENPSRRHGATDPVQVCEVCEKPLSSARVELGLRACSGPCNAAIRQMRS